MKWGKVDSAPVSSSYWVGVWEPDDDSIDLCVLQLPDKTYWVADKAWSDSLVNDVGPYASLKDAQAAAEMLAAQGINLLEN